MAPELRAGYTEGATLRVTPGTAEKVAFDRPDIVLKLQIFHSYQELMIMINITEAKTVMLGAGI